MDRELTPEEIESLLPAYALDAIDDGERTAIEAYLATHPDARAEAFSLQQTASLLGHSGGPAPAAVWDKLELAITSAPAPVVPPTPTVGPPAPVPIEQARSRRRRPVGWLVAAAALVVVLVAGAVVV